MIEMLVVIAITVILLGLIFGPVIQSFNMTREANAMTTAQDTARKTLEQVSREISQAMFVYDNSNSPINMPCYEPDGSLPTDPPKALYAKIDLVMPKMVMHCNNPAHGTSPRDFPRDDDASPSCPSCNSSDVDMRPAEPLQQDAKIVRYFIGLADSTQNGRDWQPDGPPENGFVLYRAEFDPYDTKLVDRDANNNNKPILDDPNFFYGAHAAAWRNISRVVGPAKNVDLVNIELDSTDPNKIASVTPTVRFQITQMTNDSFTPAYISDEAADAPGAIPTVFRSKYGGWGSSSGTVTPIMYDVTVMRKSTGVNYKTGLVGTDLCVFSSASGTSIFDITSYLNSTTKDTFFSPMPEMAFIVDTSRGEVRFDFPKSWLIKQSEIDTMNSNVVNAQGGGSILGREYTIPVGGTATIVPGSEIVIGPDMTPRDDDASSMSPSGTVNRPLVRYRRVPDSIASPGLNEYRINYGYDKTVPVGYIRFSNSLNEAIPLWSSYSSGGANNVPGEIEIRYRFQLNKDADVVVGNYSTKTLLGVTMGIRYYDSNSGKVFPVELTNKVRIRNLMR